LRARRKSSTHKRRGVGGGGNRGRCNEDNRRQKEEEMINLYHRDCMEAMAEMADGAYDLAIVDPPYGINVAKMAYTLIAVCSIAKLNLIIYGQVFLKAYHWLDLTRKEEIRN